MSKRDWGPGIWEKRHAFAQFERQPDRDPFTGCLLALIGMQPRSLGGDAVRQRKLLRYAGLLTQRPLSAPALAFILSDYFGEKIVIEQFQGRWRALEDDGRPRLFGEGSPDKLGHGTLVGDEGWDQQAAFRIAIGPLSRERLLTAVLQARGPGRLPASLLDLEPVAVG